MRSLSRLIALPAPRPLDASPSTPHTQHMPATDRKLSRARSKGTLRDARKDERRAYARAIRRAGKAEARRARAAA